MSNAFAMLRPLPMSDLDKDAEILALIHQLAIAATLVLVADCRRA